MKPDAFRPGAWKTSLAAAFLVCGLAHYAPHAEAADEALPAAETILDRFIEATGGKAAYERRKTEIANGTMDFAAAGIKGTVVSYAEDPSKYYSALDIPGVGKVEMGVSDGVAWEKSALMGPRIKSGDERNQALRDARMNAPYHWRELYAKAETTGVETVNGDECFKVVLTPKEGKPETMFFSKQSGLMRKTALVASSPMGDVPAEVFMDSYKDFGGLLSPAKTIQKAAGQEFTVTIESMKVNESIPPERFEMPDEVKALLKK